MSHKMYETRKEILTQGVKWFSRFVAVLMLWVATVVTELHGAVLEKVLAGTARHPSVFF